MITLNETNAILKNHGTETELFNNFLSVRPYSDANIFDTLQIAGENEDGATLFFVVFAGSNDVNKMTLKQYLGY